MLKRGNKQTISWRDLQGANVARLLFLIFGSLVFGSLVLLLIDRGNPDASFAFKKGKWASFPSSVFHPSVEFVNGTDVIWQIPDSPKAVLFLAHGCNGRAANFWDPSENCPKCVGLPEERLIVLNALSRNFAVLTISSIGRCWSMGREKENVKEIISWWVEKNNLQKLPLTAMGASSGGYFVSALAAEMSFSSITLMIAEGVFDSITITADYPPTLFVHMPKDRRRNELVFRYMEDLKKEGVKVAEIRCMEVPLNPHFFSARIPGIDQKISAKLFELFQKKGFIDGNGYMKSDGREVNWKEALREEDILLAKSKWTNHIQEEMNLAYAYHEMTSLQIDQILDWFESHMNLSKDSSVEGAS
ncbi:hypothetical protein H6P81_014257 [Aristolochia fimbriata]|uniref:Uncharacterized protein n=1 Tax=Aristolochia fimbriata TaxID=158543 RepID=A0AAV7EHI1_ARIFI|nr:hypothetical protein H6P81_014257 [Aristolochia fimbriata]